MDRLAAYDIAKARQVLVGTRATLVARHAEGAAARRRGRARTMRAALAILPVRPVRPSCCAA
jgi:hypothetical protein